MRNCIGSRRGQQELILDIRASRRKIPAAYAKTLIRYGGPRIRRALITAQAKHHARQPARVRAARLHRAYGHIHGRPGA